MGKYIHHILKSFWPIICSLWLGCCWFSRSSRTSWSPWSVCMFKFLFTKHSFFPLRHDCCSTNVFNIFEQGPQGQKGSKGSDVSCVFILFGVLMPFVVSFMKTASFLNMSTIPCLLSGFTRSEGRQWIDWTPWTTRKCHYMLTDPSDTHCVLECSTVH